MHRDGELVGRQGIARDITELKRLQAEVSEKSERLGLDQVDLQIIELVARGQSNQQIADAIFLSSNTIKDRSPRSCASSAPAAAPSSSPRPPGRD